MDAWTVDTKYTSFIVGPVKLLAFVIAVVVDAFAIDGLVNGVAAATRGIGSRVRRMADGSIATYGLWMGAVTALMAFLFLWIPAAARERPRSTTGFSPSWIGFRC